MSVTAYPVILVNSATGSDSTASGAGPGTALTGTAASVSGTATSVSITDAVNLSGVAVDGSACLYYIDTTSGHRNFDQITAISGSSGAWTVTVANGFSTSTGPFSWAIGGVRASIASASSLKLLNNNSSAGDAMPGWTVQMQSGHSETIASTLTPKRSGNTTAGYITLQGQPGASVLPVLTFSNNGTALELSGNTNYLYLSSFALKNSNATKTSSVGISVDSSGSSFSLVSGIKIADSTNNFYRGIFTDYQTGINAVRFEFCEIAYTAGDGIYGQNFPHWISNCYIHNCTGNGIYIYNYAAECSIQYNIITNNGGRGILMTSAGLNTAGIVKIVNNTIDGNTSSGMEWQSSDNFFIYFVINNIFSNNGGYGFNWVSGSNAKAQQYQVSFLNNNTYNNTSGSLNGITSVVWLNDPGLNPQYVNATGGNYGIGANLCNKGYPGSTPAIGSYSSTYSYPDIGAAQHQDSGGGGTTIITPARLRQSRQYYPQKRTVFLLAGGATVNVPVPFPLPQKQRQSRSYYPQRRTIILPAFNASPSPIPLPSRIRHNRSYYPQRRTLVLPAATAPSSLIESPRRVRQFRQYYPQKRTVVLPAANAPSSLILSPRRIRQARQCYPQRRTPFVIPGAVVLQQVPLPLSARRVQQPSRHTPVKRTVLLPGNPSPAVVISRPTRQVRIKGQPTRRQAVVIPGGVVTVQVPLLVRGKPYPMRYAYPMRRIPGAALFQSITVNTTVLVKSPRVVR